MPAAGCTSARPLTNHAALCRHQGLNSVLKEKAVPAPRSGWHCRSQPCRRCSILQKLNHIKLRISGNQASRTPAPRPSKPSAAPASQPHGLPLATRCECSPGCHPMWVRPPDVTRCGYSPPMSPDVGASRVLTALRGRQASAPIPHAARGPGLRSAGEGMAGTSPDPSGASRAPSSPLPVTTSCPCDLAPLSFLPRHTNPCLVAPGRTPDKPHSQS